jgi:tight adherence protein B
LSSGGGLSLPISLGFLAVALGWRARLARLRSSHRWVLGPGVDPAGRPGPSVSPRLRTLGGAAAKAFAVGLGSWLGWLLGGPATAVAGGIGTAVGLRLLEGRSARPDVRALDEQVSELAEGVASGVRGGLSITQAVEFAAADAQPPMREPVEEFLAARDVGVPFRTALDRLAARVGTDEIQLLALVLGVHHRSGGNVAGALDDVAATIRHRLRLRRELRALTAQGRISGAVLGVLPIGFFLVMALTSRGQLEPVLHSPAGSIMVSAGFVLEGLAFLWIRRLLRVDA